MYTRYADLKGWKVEIVSESEGTAGGYKEVVAEIKGRSVFARLKFERRSPGPTRAGYGNAEAVHPPPPPSPCCRRPRTWTSWSTMQT